MGSLFAVAVGGGIGYWIVLIGQWMGRDLTAPATVIGVGTTALILFSLPAPVVD